MARSKKRVGACSSVNRLCSKRRKKECGGRKECVTGRGKVYSLPRLYSRKECDSFRKRKRRMGFTQRASCSPFEGTRKKKKKTRSSSRR